MEPVPGKKRVGWRARVVWVLTAAGLLFAILWWTLLRVAPLPEPIESPSAQHREVDCGALPRKNLLVVLVLGQSNAANHGETRAMPREPIYSFFGGRCFAASDPLPGASGQGGSVWTRLAPTLLQPGAVDAVLLVPWAAGSTSIRAWNQHPQLVEGLGEVLRKLKLAGFEVGMVLWHQGEMESFKGTTGEAYQAAFAQWLSRLRGHGVAAPVWVAQATRCQQQENASVKAAQQRLPDQLQGVRAGPDLDRLFDPMNRYDGCHFSEAGLEAAAQAWRASIGATRQ